MWMKSDDYRFPIGVCSFFFQAVDDLAVAKMHPVESADGDNGIPELRQVVYVTMYLHN